MTISDWEMKDVEDDHWVNDVMDHKTSGAFGPAHVAVSNEFVALMEDYYTNIGGAKIISQNSMYSQRFFPTNTGNEFAKIGLLVLSSGLQRMVVATDAFKSENNVVVRNIQNHMYHSAATCENLYQYRDHQLAMTSKKPNKSPTFHIRGIQLHFSQVSNNGGYHSFVAYL